MYKFLRASLFQFSFAVMLLLGSAFQGKAQTPVVELLDAGPFDFTHYSYVLTATASTSTVTFLFRQDPSYWSLDNVSVLAGGAGSNLILNGDFETGDHSNWLMVGQQGLNAAGIVSTYAPKDGAYSWYDGAVGGVDGIAQQIATTPGQSYTFSFDLKNFGNPTNSFDAYMGDTVSSYNGNDIVPNDPVPEPSTCALLTLGGLAGLISYRRRKQVV